MPGQPGALQMTYTASSGETNDVTLSTSGDQIVLTQRGQTPLVSMVGNCTGPTGSDPKVVSCSAAGVVQIVLTLGDGDDVLVNTSSWAMQASGEGGQDIMQGGGGNDQLEGGAGPDNVDGGSGNDLLYGATLQNPGAGVDSDQLAGGSGDDRILGSGGGDRIDGGPGADSLEGAGGADMLQGADGADSLIGGDGDDMEDGGLGDDALVGGAGNDTLVPGPGTPLGDADSLTGGADVDTVTYAARMTPVDVSKDAAANDGGLGERDDVGLDVERVSGGLASDTLHGGPGTDLLEGALGDDTLDGLDGDDTLRGDAGNDNLSGGVGADVVQGEGGDDTLNGGPGPDQLLGGPGRDAVAYSTEPDVSVRLHAGSAATGLPDDRDRIDQIENVRGGAQGDTVTGSTGANDLDGRSGEDYLDGLRGVDGLDGGRGADVVVARDGTSDQPVSCGRGRDLAIIDRNDRVVRRGSRRCERVDDGSQTKPRPGWVYVRPQRCGAEAVELGLVAMHRLVPLRYSILLPSGYRRRPAPTLDASDCPVRVTATPGRRRSASADVSGAAVTVDQSSGRRVATTLTVKPPRCVNGARSAALAAGERRVRFKTRRRPGRWRMAGNFSIGASLGTDWTTVEGCLSTITIVRRGRVKVFDRVKRRTVIVPAGQRYVARR